MGKYTVYPAWVDKKIYEKLKVVIDEIKGDIPLISLILVGGFGRGEGSVKIEKDEVTPLNDFDLYAIAEKKVSEKKINQIARRIEKKLGSKGYSLEKFSPFDFYIDLRVLTLDQLGAVLPLIKYYEMKHASYVIGGEDVRDIIPDFKTEDIPFSEGVRFLFNRMSHILEWRPLHFGEVPEWQRQTLSFAITKVYLEIVTALSLIGGFYAPTYIERLKGFKKDYRRTFPGLAAKFPKLADDVEFFTNLKLEFDLEAMKDLESEWFRARTYILETSLFYCQKCFGVRNWEDFLERTSKKYLQPYLKVMIKRKTGLKVGKASLLALNYLAQMYLTFAWFLKVSKASREFYLPILTSFKDPGLRIFACLPSLISCIDRDGNINQLKFKKAGRVLQRIYPVKLEEDANLQTFNNLRKAYIDAWKIYYFQKLV